MLAVLSFVRMLLEPAMDSKVGGRGEEAGGVLGVVVPGASAACAVEWIGCTACYSSCTRTTVSRPSYPLTPHTPTCPTQVFRPPNPWVMAILALLVEVYNLDNIKTGLKFEVRAQLGWGWEWCTGARGRAAWVAGHGPVCDKRKVSCGCNRPPNSPQSLPPPSLNPPPHCPPLCAGGAAVQEHEHAAAGRAALLAAGGAAPRVAGQHRLPGEDEGVG